jgi:Mg2+/citrate symporter
MNWRIMPVPNWKEVPDQNDIVVVLVKLMVSPVVKFIVSPGVAAVLNGYTLRRLTRIRVIDMKAIVLNLGFFIFSILPFE